MGENDDEDDGPPKFVTAEGSGEVSTSGPTGGGGAASSGHAFGPLGGPSFEPTGKGGAMSTASTYYGSCDTGRHAPWTGPNQNTYAAAQADCDAHNERCDARGAHVVTF